MYWGYAMAEKTVPGATTPAKKERWWTNFIWAPLMVAAAVYFYIDLTRFEEEGGTRRMNVIIIAVYHVLGKWGVVGVFALAAIVFVVTGVMGFRKRNAGQQSAG
jgi:hypothetical protein